MRRASVIDVQGQPLSPCSEDKARRLVQTGRAALVSEDPLVIRLAQAVQLPERAQIEPPGQGKRLLLHICCAPCATYTVQRLGEQGWEVHGYWFNPNIQPYGEHEKRRESLARYAEEIGLLVIWEAGYAMPAFLRAIAGHERYRERCLICYALRLEQTARVAQEHGFDAFTTTLLISPYQDQQALRRIGEKAAQEHGVAFYFENLRRGFVEHHRLAEEHNLYRQRYCGCIYSDWEAQDRQASTRATNE